MAANRMAPARREALGYLPAFSEAILRINESQDLETVSHHIPHGARSLSGDDMNPLRVELAENLPMVMTDRRRVVQVSDGSGTLGCAILVGAAATATGRTA